MNSPPNDEKPSNEPDPLETTSSIWSAIWHAKNPDDPRYETAWTNLVNRYTPVITKWMRRNFGSDDAEQLTQDFIGERFFQKLIPSKTLGPGVGFRRCLYRALQSFWAERLRKRYSQKRGSGQAPVSLDAIPNAEELGVKTNPDESDRAFNRDFARHAFDRAFNRVRRECAEEKGKTFELLTGLRGNLSDEQIGSSLGIRPGAVRVRRHRLKKRLEQAFREELADLVEPGHLEAEWGDLIGLL